MVQEKLRVSNRNVLNQD